VLTHANVVGNLVPIETEIKKYLKYERLVHPIRFLNLLPLSHVFGQFLGCFCLRCLAEGRVRKHFNPREVMATIRRERVSVLVAVPRMIESLKQKIERDLEDAGGREKFATRYAKAANQHFCGAGGRSATCAASLDGILGHDQRRRGAGSRDRGILASAGIRRDSGLWIDRDDFARQLEPSFHTSRGSIGKVLPGREIKLAEGGEILVRGSGVASGYWNGRELQPVARTEDEGWYRTGDLGALDEQGNLFFKGRKKEVIVTPAGMNIYPEDLEAALRGQNEVRDCAVVGLERGGNAEPCAC